MSTIARIKCRCAVCGARNELAVLCSTNEFGSPDLDLRPPEMKRRTMSLWVQECSKCGYAAEDISEDRKVPRDLVQSEKYNSCEGHGFESALARKFYKSYMINRHLQLHADAFYDVLHAAWACDDKEDGEGAKLCRVLAFKFIPTLIKERAEDKETLLVMAADLLRRSGHFEELINSYQNIRFSTELLNEILSFEIAKAKEKDAGCYAVSDVVKNRHSPGYC